MDKKPLVLNVRLSAEDADALERARGSSSQSAFIRMLIREADAGERGTVASRDEALALLSEQARAGRVPATIALARELRAETPGDAEMPPWMQVGSDRDGDASADGDAVPSWVR